jgi:hypothetical protein
MKRRYTVLFALSVIAMIGWSWHATTSGTSVWSMIDVGLFGLITATFVAGLSTMTGTNGRGPLIWIFFGSLLGAGQVPTDGELVIHGIETVMIGIGSIGTFLAALIIALMPPPPDTDDAGGVAPARVIH